MGEPTTEQLAEWEAWLAERPPEIVEVARRLPPWQEYRYTETGQRAQLYSYGEGNDGRVTITAVLWRDDFPEAMIPLTARTVFGLDPAHFVPIEAQAHAD